MFQCQECKRKFRTTKAADRAVDKGCPGCGGTDIDLDAGYEQDPKPKFDTLGRPVDVETGEILDR
jgi:hypothetical protein